MRIIRVVDWRSVAALLFLLAQKHSLRSYYAITHLRTLGTKRGPYGLLFFSRVLGGSRGI